MNSRILYPTDDGGVAIIIPAESIEAAMKDIPPIKEIVNGEVVSSSPRPYKIVDAADIPADREFRAAWTADFTEVTE